MLVFDDERYVRARMMKSNKCPEREGEGGGKKEEEKRKNNWKFISIISTFLQCRKFVFDISFI